MAKKTGQVVVQYKGSVHLSQTALSTKDKNPSIKTGRLVITNSQTNTSWTYYLKGVQ